MNPAKSLLFIFASCWLLLMSGLSFARHAAILVDADNGKILFEQDAYHAWYPASLTKVMTLYMTFTALRQGEVQLQEQMAVSHYAARQPNSKLGLRFGEGISVEEAILALITRSANDAAVVLAEHLGGNEENFAARMTAKAHALGMYDTHFMNATGLPHQWQVTTPRDLALLGYRVYHDFPEYYPYFAAHSLFFRGHEWKAINKFTASYPGAEGMKTGFTCGSGYNLMSSAQQNGKRLIGVVMGGMSSPQRYQLMTEMMDDGFSSYMNTDGGLNITTLPPKFPSTPPHLLGCGRESAEYSFARYSASAATSTQSHHALRHPAPHTRALHNHHAPTPRLSRARKAVKKALVHASKSSRHHYHRI